MGPDADPRLLVICMTPRSGSTALSAALAATGQLGIGGYLKISISNNAALLTRFLADAQARIEQSLPGAGVAETDEPAHVPA